MKKLPIGIWDFEKVITGDYYFIDKSLFVKEILDDGAEALLIPRPRRFGKTLNMTMLKCFFEKNSKSKRHLFDNLLISHDAKSMKHQGQYPVIFVTFKDSKVTTWQECYQLLTQTISREFVRHKYVMNTSLLNPVQKKDFADVINKTADPTLYYNSIKDLSEYLTQYHKKKPIILIDEYDAPIQAGFVNGYYKEVMNFMRGVLGAGLKDNPSLDFAVMTGILRVAKESIFSGLNNLKVCSLINNAHSASFGLHEHEVKELLEYYSLSHALDDVRIWYNGYASGDHDTVYNPWSLINFASTQGKLQPYWLNTSDNVIIQQLIEQASTDIKLDIEQLLAGNTIEKYVNESIVFDRVFSQSDAVWSFLLFSGYLSFNKIYLKEELLFGSLRLPNLEVKSFYKVVILEWLKNHMSMNNYLSMLTALLNGNIEEFKEIFYEFVIKSLSSFDTSGDEPEKFYHALVLGMLMSLSEHYEVKSNKESGYGRYDVMIIPKNPIKRGIIIEFKKVKKSKKDSLENAVEAALKQIEDKEYATEFHVRGIKDIIKLGIAFDGKKVLVKEKIN